MMSMRRRLIRSGLVLAVLSLAGAVAMAQPERFSLPARLTDLTVLGDLAQRGDLTAPDRTEILVTWYIRELREPTPTTRGLGGPIDSGWIQCNIIESLGGKGDPDVVAAVAGDADVEPDVRDAMCIVLGMKGDSSQTARLITILQSHPREYDRATAAQALGALGATEAVPALEEALRDPYVVEVWPDTDPSVTTFYPVRRCAEDALRALRTPQVVAASRSRSRQFVKRMKGSADTMIPLRSSLPSAGWSISWSEGRKEAVAVHTGNALRVVVGDGYATVNNRKVQLARPPVLRGDKLLVPRSLLAMLAYKATPLAKLAMRPASETAERVPPPGP